MATDTVKPEVGMGATIVVGSDRYAATVIAASPSGKRITLQYDKAYRADENGLSESQEYLYSADPNGRTREYSQRKNGVFYPVGQPMQYRSGAYLGVRETYRDPSF